MTALKSVRIGGASGYWGESAMATPQLLQAGNIDYLVYDYLAEITMSLLARARARDPEKGYATDFITAVLKPHLRDIAASEVRLITNAGGLNPEACATAALSLIEAAGLDLKVAVITGDNLMNRLDQIAATAPREMFSGEDFPEKSRIASINAYIGAFPIARALDAGADIIITGRCVDSAVTLGIGIHEFGWQEDAYDLLASGALAGHILECGPQATGGNFTDWQLAGDFANIGYPIAELFADGSFTLTKPEGTGGIVSIGTVSEQLVYEIGDPQAYILPDVICDFSEVKITQTGDNIVHVSPARGYPAPECYKICATYTDGYRTGTTVTIYGFEAAKRGAAFAEAAFTRARRSLRALNAPDFTETDVEILGAGAHFGAASHNMEAREVVVKIAAKHPTALEGGVLLKEIAGLGLATPPGLCGFKAGSAKPTPVIRLYSCLTPKSDIVLQIHSENGIEHFRDRAGTPFDPATIKRPAPPEHPPRIANQISAQNTAQLADMIEVPLVTLAWGRSGDKGNKANIGIIARRAAYLPFIWAALDEARIAACFAHFIAGGQDKRKIQRFLLPGIHAINFLIDDALGGGGIASIRSDPQAKGYAQILLAQPIPLRKSLIETTQSVETTQSAFTKA